MTAEGFSCSLGILYGGLGKSKLQFLIKKIKIKFPAVISFHFRSSNPGSGSGIRNLKKSWIRIRIRIKSMRIRNPDGRPSSLSNPILSRGSNPCSVQDKTVLVEPTADFTLCEVVREVSVLRHQATTSLFPLVQAQFR